MRNRTIKLGLLVAVTAMAAAFPLVVAQPAFADYAPSKGDIVGVGSDTLQYLLDFTADGDAFADPGYNAALNKYKLISFDATADANARLAYGVDGGQAAQASCTPGTGSTKGSGNATTPNAGVPCVLNPTVVLRAGLQPVQRPNGSGAGLSALEQDIVAGNNVTAGTHQEIINFSRASATEEPGAGAFGIDQLEVASDTLPMLVSNLDPTATTTSTANVSTFTGTQSLALTASSAVATFGQDGTVQVATSGGTAVLSYTGVTEGTTPSLNAVATVSGTGTLTGSVSELTNAIALSSTELGNIYKATTGGTNAYGTAGCVTWNELPNAPAGTSTDAIIPIIPQVGSGTRSFFLGQIGNITPGNCDQVGEENDPTATAQQAFPADAVEPISNGRLQLFLGTTNSFPSASQPTGYFLDPSCPYLSAATGCGAGTGAVGPLQQTFVTAGDNGTNVTALAGTLDVSTTTGFLIPGTSCGVAGKPACQIDVETQSGNALLAYTGLTAATFTGVTIVTGTGFITSGVLNGGSSNTLDNLVFQGFNTWFTNAVLPPVKVLATSGNASDGNPVFDVTRQLYIEFRDSDVYSTAPFQPGTTENWLNTLFYDPCLNPGSGTCVTGPGGANEYGPDGQPYIDTTGGQTLLSDAGVTPVDTGLASSFTKY